MAWPRETAEPGALPPRIGLAPSTISYPPSAVHSLPAVRRPPFIRRSFAVQPLIFRPASAASGAGGGSGGANRASSPAYAFGSGAA